MRATETLCVVPYPSLKQINSTYLVLSCNRYLFLLKLHTIETVSNCYISVDYLAMADRVTE